MDNISEYIDVLIQAPIAVIQVIFIYMTIKLLTSFMNQIIKQSSEMVSKLSISLNEAIKIIKQQERKNEK